MKAPILNREFQHPDDGWYQIEPKGEHPNPVANVIQIIDDQAATAIVNRFNADSKTGKLRHGSEMLIDHEHFSDQPDQETRAYGWLQQLQNRDDGIYGRIRWTATGKPAVDGGDYRFFSTEYDPQSLKLLNDGKVRRVRPFRLDGLTLTNMHNNRGQRPITNRRPSDEVAVDNEAKKTKGQQMKSVATKLGLSADASEEAVLAEVIKLTNRGDITPADLTTLRNRSTTLETENGVLLDEQVDGLLAEHKITDDKVKNRLKPILKPLKNRGDRVACLIELGFDPAEKKEEPAGSARVLNRGKGQPETLKAGANEELVKVDKIRNRAAELKGKGVSFDVAWAQATSEVNTAK